MDTRKIESMNTRHVGIELLSDDELDAAAGGYRNMSDPAVTGFLIAFVGAAGSAGGHYFVDQLMICA
jgi:hypothetical protein